MKRLMFVLALLFLVGFVSAAQPTQQYGKILLTPQYRASMTSNTNYTYSATITVPDGMTSVRTAMVTFNVWMSPTVNYNLWVNGAVCNNPTYQISTTYSGAGNAEVTFECSNIITSSGSYNITLRADKNSGASTAWIDLTYQNNPRGTATVHGTEYTPGDDAKLWLQLLDANNDDVTSGVCYIDIYTPQNTYFVEGATMNNLNHDGIYYYDVVAPVTNGVYPAIAKCYYVASQDKRNATSFNLISGSVQAGTTYLNTNLLDGVYHTIATNKNGGLTVNNRVNISYNFSSYFSSCGNVSEALITGITIYYNGVWNTGTLNHDVFIYTYNYTSNSWVLLGNKIPGGSGAATQTITNSITTTNITKALGITSTKPMQVRFADNDINEGAKDLKLDYIYASCDQLSSPGWQEVKGSSEMHVTSPDGHPWDVEVISGEVTNATYPGDFYYNFTVESATLSTQNWEVQVDMPIPFPCEAVEQLTINGVNTSFKTRLPDNPAISGCQVYWDQDLNVSTNYGGIIKAENYFKEVESGWITESTFDYQVINLACKNYQVTNNFSNFTIPAASAPELGGDDFYDLCWTYMNRYAEFNDSYWNEFRTDAGTFDKQQMDALNEQWKHLREEITDIQQQSTNILSGLTVGAAYSTAVIANPTGQTIPFYATYWANSSTSYLNYRLLSAINLTTFTQSPTAIASAVWNYSGTITNNILTQIATDVWSATTRTLSAFGFFDYPTAAEFVWNSTTNNRTLFNEVNISTLTANDVWNYNNRNLTYLPTVNATINESSLSDVVWNNSARYTHGVILN